MMLDFTVSIEPLGKRHYSVPIRSGNKPYTVDLRIFYDAPGYESCSCPYFQRRASSLVALLATARATGRGLWK
jgi:hypothetical protein